MSKTAFLYPGQGSQWEGMMTEFAAERVWKSPGGFNPDCPGPAIVASYVKVDCASLVQTADNWS